MPAKGHTQKAAKLQKERGSKYGKGERDRKRVREKERSGKTRQDYKCVSSNSQKFPFYCSFSSSLSRRLCLCENVCLFVYL